MTFDKSHGKVTTIKPVYDPFDDVCVVRHVTFYLQTVNIQFVVSESVI